MKEIKQIKIEDCVECYVSNCRIPTIQDSKRFIICKTNDEGYVDSDGAYWKNAIPCELIDNPPKPKWSDKYPQEWSIHAKVFKAISEGAVVRDIGHNDAHNVWYIERDHRQYQICTNYTGTDSDVWEDIE